MSDFRVGDNVPEVRIGSQVIRNVEVTEQNAALIADGDIDLADIQELKGADGDASAISPADFQAVGFEVTGMKFVFQGVQEVVDAAAAAAPTPAAGSGEPVSKRDLATWNDAFVQATNERSEALSSELRAMRRTRVGGTSTEELFPSGQMVALRQPPASQEARGAMVKLNNLKTRNPEAYAAIREQVVAQATRSPQMTAVGAVNMLVNVGFSADEAGRMVEQSRSEAAAALNARTAEIVGAGGGNTNVSAYMLSTGGGGMTSTTAEMNNTGRGFLLYGSYDMAAGDRRLAGTETQTMHMAAVNPAQPSRLALQAGGADGGGAEITIRTTGPEPQTIRLSVDRETAAIRLNPPDARLPEGFAWDARSSSLELPAGITGVELSQTSNRLPGAPADDPFDEIFLRVTGGNLKAAERLPAVVHPPETPEMVIPPPPGPQPGDVLLHIKADANRLFAGNSTNMRELAADHSQKFQDLAAFRQEHPDVPMDLVIDASTAKAGQYDAYTDTPFKSEAGRAKYAAQGRIAPGSEADNAQDRFNEVSVVLNSEMRLEGTIQCGADYINPDWKYQPEFQGVRDAIAASRYPDIDANVYLAAGRGLAMAMRMEAMGAAPAGTAEQITVKLPGGREMSGEELRAILATLPERYQPPELQ